MQINASRYNFIQRISLLLMLLFIMSGFLSVSLVHAAGGDFVWATATEGENPGSAMGLDIIVDTSGNVYTTGAFQGNVDFDPSPGTFNLTSAGDFDIFISKLDNSGNFVWAKTIGGTSGDFGKSISVDTSGNVYIIGDFQGTVDFDPGPGTFNLTSTGDSDIFMIKLDSSGNLVSAVAIGGISGDYGGSIAVDSSGNVYVSGGFQGTVDFDPGPGTYNLTSAGNTDIFINKLDSSGNFSWASALGGSSWEFVNGISVDLSGNVHATGTFQSTADFDPGPGTFNLTSAGSDDIFINKLDSSGNFLWAKRIGGTLLDYGSDIKVDSSGNVYTTGIFKDIVDFDPTGGTSFLASAGSNDVFISKLDSTGNYIWAGQMGGTSNDFGKSISVDSSGNVYTTGDFSGTVDFDPGRDTYNLVSPGGSVFISKLDSSCNFVWAKAIDGTSFIAAQSIAVDTPGNIFVTGQFQETADFDPGPGTFNLTSDMFDNGDMFTVHLSGAPMNTFSIGPMYLLLLQ